MFFCGETISSRQLLSFFLSFALLLFKAIEKRQLPSSLCTHRYEHLCVHIHTLIRTKGVDHTPLHSQFFDSRHNTRTMNEEDKRKKRV